MLYHTTTLANSTNERGGGGEIERERERTEVTNNFLLPNIPLISMYK